MGPKIKELGPFAWRLMVYDGEYLAHGVSLPCVIDIRGESVLEWDRAIPDDVAQRCLLTVVGSLRLYSDGGHPIRPFAMTKPLMTVCVEQLYSIESNFGKVIARLDLAIEGTRAQGSLLVTNQPRIDLDPVVMKRSDGVLDVLVRLLLYMLS